MLPPFWWHRQQHFHCVFHPGLAYLLARIVSWGSFASLLFLVRFCLAPSTWIVLPGQKAHLGVLSCLCRHLGTRQTHLNGHLLRKMFVFAFSLLFADCRMPFCGHFRLLSAAMRHFRGVVGRASTSSLLNSIASLFSSEDTSSKISF